MGEVTAAHMKAIRHEAAKKAWLKRKRKGDQPPAPAQNIARGDWNQNNTEAQRQLMSSPVASAKPLGGGISETYVVTLASGQKANFKVSDGDSDMNEVRAWEMAQLVGMEDMVPPAVIRTIEVPGWPGKHARRRTSGSMALWQEGEVAMRRGADRFDGPEDLQRAAAFDIVIGQMDRHENNWVINRDGKIRLIDHGFSFGYVHSRFVDEVRTGTLSRESPAKFIAPYLAKKSQIAAKLRASGLDRQRVADVLRRIDHVASAKTWADVSDQL